MAYHHWTTKEIAYAAASTNRQTLAEIAAHLGVTVPSLVNMLIRQGLTRSKEPRADWEPILRRLHCKGQSDAVIARATGWSRETTRKRRNLLGLSVNPWKGSRARYRRQMQTAEANNLVDLRWRPKRIAKLLESDFMLAPTPRTSSAAAST